MTVFSAVWFLPLLVVLVGLRFLLRRRPGPYLAAVTAASIATLGALQPLATVTLLAIVAAVYGTALSFRQEKSRAARRFVVGLVALLAAMLVGKYGHSLFETLTFGTTAASRRLFPILGISYFCFRLAHYLIEAYRGTLKETSPLGLAAYVFFLPTFQAGPLETYPSFHARRMLEPRLEDFGQGLWRVTVGYFKKTVLLGIVFGQFLDPLLNGPDRVASPKFAPTYLLNTVLHAYLDLSAYTDLAIGFSLLLGFRIAENFHFPFAATNLGTYWNRWHMTLSNWCRNNVYFPVFGWTRNPTLGLYASMITMGLWHHFSLTWLFWGAYHATGLTVVMRWSRLRRKLPRVDKFLRTPAGTLAGWALTMAFVTLGYAFVAQPSFRDAWRVAGNGIRGVLAAL